MKKFFSLFLAALMLLAIVPAYGFAAGEAHVDAAPTPVPYHEHKPLSGSTVTVRDGWIYYDADHHVYRYKNSSICEICGYAYTWISKGTYSTRQKHSYKLDSATCNGKTQTHVYECGPCLDRYTKSVVCPGGPHSGACGYLPRFPR